MLTIAALDRRKKTDRARFLNLPFGLYQGDRNWVPPLLIAEHVKLNNDPFYDHAEVQLFMAVRDGRDVGRIAAIENQAHNRVHHDKVGFFGFFECENRPETARALCSAAEDWVAGRGLDLIRGPVNPSTNHTLGVLIHGEEGPPMIDMTYNPPYYDNLISAAGYTKSMDVVAHAMDVTSAETFSRLQKMAQRAESKPGVTHRCLDMKHFGREVEMIKQLYNDAWELNWGFVPLTDREIDHLAEDLKMVVDPGLVRFVFVDGKPAGFLAAVLNMNEILIKMNGRLLPSGLFKILLGKPKIKSIRLLLMGVTQPHRNQGLETVMYYHALKHAMQKGYSVCENSFLLETNTKVIRASEFMGGREYRRYRIYDKPLIKKN